MEKGVKLDGVDGVRYMYHDPCHTPMKTYAPLKVVGELMGTKVRSTTAAAASRARSRRRARRVDAGALPQGEEMRKGAAALRADGHAGRSRC
jgi:hypothetical protein